MRPLLTALAFIGAALLVATVMAVVVLLLAGPHGGLLPAAAQPWVLGAAWIIVFALPAWIARKVWLRLGAIAAPPAAAPGEP